MRSLLLWEKDKRHKSLEEQRGTMGKIKLFILVPAPHSHDLYSQQPALGIAKCCRGQPPAQPWCCICPDGSVWGWWAPALQVPTESSSRTECLRLMNIDLVESVWSFQTGQCFKYSPNQYINLLQLTSSLDTDGCSHQELSLCKWEVMMVTTG